SRRVAVKGWPVSLVDENDLADVLAPVQHLMGRCGLREWERPVHGHAHAPIQSELERPADLVRRGDAETANAVAAAEERNDVERYNLTGMCPARDELAICAQGLHVHGELRAADGVDHGIDAF